MAARRERSGGAGGADAERAPSISNRPKGLLFDLTFCASTSRTASRACSVRAHGHLREPGCTPIANAVVDVWQCDVDGVYAGASRAQYRLARWWTQITGDGKVGSTIYLISGP
jgi:hypothetical protein